MVRRRQRFARAFGVIVDHEFQGMHHPDAALGPFQVFPEALFQDAVVNPAARHTRHAALFHEVADRRRRITAAAQPHDRGHTGIVPTVDELLVHELNELTLGEHDVRQAQPVEFMLMRKKEEILPDHRRKRSLQQGRKVIRVLRQKKEERLPRLIRQRFRPLRRLPLIKDFGHRSFGRTLPQLFTGMEGRAGKSERTVIVPRRHLRNQRLRFFKLRRTQHRHDALQGPIVESALIFEFERADRMRNVFERIFDGMRKGVHRIDAPLVARRLVFGKADAVNRRIPQVDVGRRHINFGSEHHRAFGVLAVPHLAENPQVFFGGTVAEGRILTGFLQGAAVRAHFVRGLFVHVSVTGLDEVFGEFVHPVKVVGGVVKVRFRRVLPVKPQPVDAFHDAVHVLLVFLHRVRVVKTHVAVTAEFLGKPEIKADAFGVPDMQVPVRFRRKTRTDLRHVFRAFLFLHAVGRRVPAPLTGTVRIFSEVVFNQGTDKVDGLHGRVRRFGFCHKPSFVSTGKLFPVQKTGYF